MTPEVPAVTVTEVPAGATLLDVREDDEWVAGHAPEAVHVPMSQFLSRLDDVPEGPLAVVCRVGGRSAQVTAYLVGQGREAVNVNGGMLAWEAAGLVPTDVEGLEIHGIETMGGKEVNDLYFTNCRLPSDAVVGTEGQGWRQLMAGLNLERMILAGLMLGLGRRAFDDTLAYVTTREQFGRPVGTFQAMRHRIADNATELAATKLLVHDTAHTIDANPTALFPKEASMAKLKATELAKHLSLEGMQMLGGYGYATEYGMERLLRQSVVSTVYGGTSEIQRDIIGKTLGL
jgi:rhodanese-related sulfurtransferase